MPRKKKIQISEPLFERGIFGNCSCGGRVLFYSDTAVKCEVCNKLYGLWFKRWKRSSSMERLESLLGIKHTINTIIQ